MAYNGDIIMILSISGQKGVGKSTIASMFVDKYKFTELTFAQPLKRAISVAFSVSLHSLEVQDEKERIFDERSVSESELDVFLDVLDGYRSINKDERRRCHLVKVKYKTLRELMQLLGTDVIRKQVCDNFWINILIDRVSASESTNIVVTDARFPNERKALKSLQAQLMLVKRGVVKNDGHLSENMLGLEPDYDVVVDNSGVLIRTLHEVDLWYTLKGHKS